MNANNDLITNWPSLHPPTHASNINMTAVLLPPIFLIIHPFPTTLPYPFHSHLQGETITFQGRKLMLPQGERLMSQGEGTLSTTVAAPVTTLALIKMVPLRFDAFPSTANHMNLLTPTILFLSPCTLFQLSPTLLTAHQPIIPRSAETIPRRVLLPPRQMVS